MLLGYTGVQGVLHQVENVTMFSHPFNFNHHHTAVGVFTNHTDGDLLSGFNRSLCAS